MLLYASCAATEKCIEWEPDFTTIYTDLTEAKTKFKQDLQTYTQRALKKLHHKGSYEYIMCISNTQNFRKLVLPTYKGNRTKRKPCGYKFLKEWVEENYRVAKYPMLEADDAISVLSGDNTCILSGDKDMLTIEHGQFYHFLKDELYTLTEEQGEYKWLYQSIIGDTTDGYKGCPGVGDKGACKALDEDCSWKTVVSLYEKKGLTEEEALVQARVARILHKEDYNVETGEISLWSPEGKPKDILCTSVELTREWR